MTFTVVREDKTLTFTSFSAAQAAAGWGRRQVLGAIGSCGTCAEGVRRMADDTAVPSRRKVVVTSDWWTAR